MQLLRVFHHPSLRARSRLLRNSLLRLSSSLVELPSGRPSCSSTFLSLPGTAYTMGSRAATEDRRQACRKGQELSQ